jgi:hypothetical protein
MLTKVSPSSTSNFISVAVSARTVPENETLNSPTNQVSAFSNFSSVAANARAVPQAATLQISPFRTISTVAANARDIPQAASPDENVYLSSPPSSPLRRKKGQRGRCFDDSSHSHYSNVDRSHRSIHSTTPEPAILMIPRYLSGASREELFPSHMCVPGQNARCDKGRISSPGAGCVTSDVAMQGNIEMHEMGISYDKGPVLSSDSVTSDTTMQSYVETEVTAVNPNRSGDHKTFAPNHYFS